MEKLEKYRDYVRQMIDKYARYKPSYGEMKVEKIVDTKTDRYLIVHVGWNQQRRIYGTVIHIDIEDEKIWIQWNGTESDLAEELVEMGVPKQDIGIGFHSPYMRQFTEYAMG